MKKKFSIAFFALILAFCSFARGQVATASPVAVNQSGAPLGSTLVTICTTNPGTGTCATKSTLFTDNTLTTPCTGTAAPLNNLAAPTVGSGCSNPGFTDLFGNAVAFSSGGLAWCQYSGATITTYSQPCFFPGGTSTVFPLTSPQTVNTNGSLSNLGLGQIFGTGLVLPEGLDLPVGSVTSTSGGTINNQTFEFQVTYNSALGETVPSLAVTVNTSTCGGNACIVTITAPVLPSGYTGYSVYDCSSGQCEIGVLKQTASANCVNITGNCVISTPGTGSAPPTANTAWFQPSNVQTYECPPSVLPSLFIPDNSGNLHTQAGVDENSGNGRTTGTLTFCRSVWFNDTLVTPPAGNNAMIAISHQWGLNVSTTNQDRGLHVNGANLATDTGTHYGLEVIQSEGQFLGAPSAITGTPDGEVSALSASMSDQHTNTIASPSFAINGGRILLIRSGAGNWSSCNDCEIGLVVSVGNANTASFNGDWFTGILVGSGPSVSGAANANYRGIHISSPQNVGATQLVEQTIIGDAGATAYNFNIDSSANTEETGANVFAGKTYIQHEASANVITTLGSSFTNPTCSATGVGTGSAATRSGSSDSLGRCVLTVAGGTGAGTGTATITFHTAFSTPNTDVSCQATLEDNSGAWNGLAAIRVTAHSTSAVTFTWTNGTTPTALANGTYDLNYRCWGS